MRVRTKQLVYFALLLASFFLVFFIVGIVHSPVFLLVVGSLVLLFSITRIVNDDPFFLCVGLVLYAICIDYLFWYQNVFIFIGLISALAIPVPLSLLVSQTNAVVGGFITYGIGLAAMEIIQGVALNLSFAPMMVVALVTLVALFIVLKVLLSEKEVMKFHDSYGKKT